MSTKALPVIDDVQMPATVAVAHGYYWFKAVVTYHDVDDAVPKMRVRTPAFGNQTYDWDLGSDSGLYAHASWVDLEWWCPANDVPKGELELDFSGVDAEGLEGAVWKQIVKIQ